MSTTPRRERGRPRIHCLRALSAPIAFNVTQTEALQLDQFRAIGETRNACARRLLRGILAQSPAPNGPAEKSVSDGGVGL